MKKRTKLIGLVLSAALLTGTFTGCSYEEEYVPVDTQTDVLQNTENSNGTVSIPNLTQNLPVNGEDFSLICKYDTGKYSLKNWHVTDAKSINMNVHTKNLPDGYDVMVEHMHADILSNFCNRRIHRPVLPVVGVCMWRFRNCKQYL